MRPFTKFLLSVVLGCIVTLDDIQAENDFSRRLQIQNKLYELLSRRLPFLFDPEADMVKRYNSDYAFGLGKRNAYGLIPEHSLEYVDEPNSLDEETPIDANHLKREGIDKYTFGLGKRRASYFNYGPSKKDSERESDDDTVYESPLYDNVQTDDFDNRRVKNSYAFGLGKRASGNYEFGLGKRGSGNYQFGLGKRGSGSYGFGLGKRGSGSYGFGLGKRGSSSYGFGLGKRIPGSYEFGLGKRRPGSYEFGLGKRGSGNYEFGLGKRGPGDYGFGLGKRGRSNYAFGLGKRGDYELYAEPQRVVYPIIRNRYNQYEVQSADPDKSLNKKSRSSYGFGLGKRSLPSHENLKSEEHNSPNSELESDS